MLALLPITAVLQALFLKWVMVSQEGEFPG
jgi:hypothetical protein